MTARNERSVFRLCVCLSVNLAIKLARLYLFSWIRIIIRSVSVLGEAVLHFVCLCVYLSARRSARQNGTVEPSIKIAIKIIKKTYDYKSDIWLAVLEWQIMPTKDMRSSPVHRLMARRTRSLVAMTQNLLIP